MKPSNNTKQIIILITMIALIIPIISLSAAAEWKDAAWDYRKPLTINHNSVAGDLTDYAVLVDITDSGLIGKAQDDADDFLFTADDEVTQLPHEIESYDPSTGHLVAWVKISSLSSTTDTIIYMYYGNPSAASQAQPTSVWDSNFLAVQHLEEVSGTATDSTLNDNDGAVLNGVTQDSAGKIDGADRFDGSDDRIVMPQVFTNQNQFTFEAWVNTANKHGYIVSQRDGSSNGAFLQYYPTTFQIYSNNVHITRPATVNTWQYVVGSYDGSTLRLYVNAGTPAASTATITWPALQTFIGDRSALGRAFQGSLDEIRISNIARSQSYITTSYNNQNNPAGFISLGAEEINGVPAPTITSPIPADGATNVPITTTTLSFTIADPQGDLLSYSATTNPNIGSKSQSNVPGGTYILSISGLEYDTLYTWQVTVTDGTDTTQKTFTFTTKPEVVSEPGWAFRRQITLDRTKVSGTLNNFPVLIDATIDPSKAQGNAHDIYFTLEDGITKLAHEIDYYDSTTGKILAWVSLPSISSSADTMLYMYYGNSEAPDQQNSAGVWDSDFLVVQHLEEKTGTSIVDSTANANNGLAMNGLVLDAVGKINGADLFDGNDDRIVMPQVFTNQNQFTFEAWVNTANKQGYIVSQRDGSGNGAFLQYYPTTFQIYSNNVHIVRPASVNTWQYVVGSYDGSTLRLYVNAGTPAASTASITWPALQTFIGDRSALGRAFQGSLDEIRISKVARSQSYITTSYNNQNDPVGFRTVGAEEQLSTSIALMIMNEKPANGKNDVPIETLTELSFDLYDPQGDLMNYTVTTNPNIGSGSANNVPDGTYTVNVSGLVPGVLYTWTVSATDGKETVEKTFSFTAVSQPLQASFSGAYPVNRNTTYNPRLSITVNEQTGKDLTITFETNMTGTWQPIATQNGKAGTYHQQTYNMMTKGRRYYWRATVSDGYSSKTSDVYSFLVQAAFIQKWSYNHNAETYNGPIAVDVNNDGLYEVCVSGFRKITCLNPLTGIPIWTYSDSSLSVHSPIEAADLNNDGIPEIVAPASEYTVALHANNGSVYWRVRAPSANKYPIIVDTDANHYPYVYVADSDHYYGTAKISKLRGTDGAIMAQADIWYPCFSGLSAGDADNDGKLEIYMCDRRMGYEGSEGLGRGMQAYDADDLSLLWYDGGITCSSNLVALADVNNDGVLDSIALQQSGGSGGIYVIDGTTGLKMPGKWEDNIGLRTHSPPSIYDIDLDGRLELIDGRDGPAKVWDIGSWSLDAYFPEYSFSEPPRFADIYGDSKLEIVGVTPGFLRIYDWRYQLVESHAVDYTTIAQTMVQDIDNDGQNELIVISFGGNVRVFETSAYVSDPKPRSNVQLYGERRVGVGVYESLPGAPQPIIKEVYPLDTAINVDFNPTLRARVVDFRYDKMDVTISIKEGDNWKEVKSFTGADNGWFEYTPINMDQGDTTYYWRVSAIDTEADNMLTVQEFSFTTKPKVGMMPGWDYKNKITIDHNKVAGALTNFPVLIDFTDAEVASKAKADGSDIFFTSASGTKLSHEVELYDSTTGRLVAWVNVPSLSSSADTIIYMYYGNPSAAPQQNPAGVWDSNYMAVHHLEEVATTDITDSTVAGNDGTAINITDTSLGKINGADVFDGVSSRITLPKLFTNQNQFTIEGWYYLAGDKNNIYIISQRDLSQNGMLVQYFNGQMQMYVNNRLVSRPTFTYAWHYVVGTYDGTTMRLYINDNAPVTNTATVTWPDLPTVIGNRPAYDRAFLGNLDEIRISNVARSEAYIRTSYANQNNPASFISISPAETAEGSTKPAVLNELPSHLSTNVPYETAELSFEIFDAQDDLMDYTVTTYPNINVAPVVVKGASNGKVIVPVKGLMPNTEYTWTIQVTDGVETNTKVLKFKTAKAYTLTLSTSGQGTVSIDKPVQPYYTTGTQVRFTATPAPGWMFIGWSGGRLGNVYGTQNPVVVTLNDNVAIYKDRAIGLENHPAMDVAMTAFFRPIGVPLIADSTFDASIDSADLRANAEIQDWWESRNNTWTWVNITPGVNETYYGQELLTLDTSTVGGYSGKKAKLAESPFLDGALRLNAYMVQEFSAEQPGSFSVEFDIYVDTILDYRDSDRAAQIMIGRDSGSWNGPLSGSSDKFIIMGFYHEDGSTVHGDTMSLIAPGIDSSLSNSTTWDYTISSSLRMDKWYRIRIDVNVPARTYNVYVYDVAVSGEQLTRGSLLASRTNLPAYSTLLSRVSHIGFASWNDGPGTFYVDNVREYVP